MLLKELKLSLCSLSGAIFILIFLIITGSLLWIIPGEYNIPDNGYASMHPFFTLAPFLLMLLIPALAMRTLSEEKRSHTLSLLLTRPVNCSSIILSKISAVWITVIIAIIPTFIYAISIFFFGNPTGNLDWGSIGASYVGLLILALCYTCIAVFSSAITSNQTVALILGISLIAALFFGPDLISGLFLSGRTQIFVREFGLFEHYKSIQRGLIDLRDIFYILAIAYLFFLLSVFILKPKIALGKICICLSLFVLSCSFSYRIDLTKEKRYTLSDVTQKVLSQIKSPVDVELYLDGSLNPGFVQLQKATLETIEDFNRFAPQEISVHAINPYLVTDKEFLQKLSNEGIKGISVNEKDTEGKISQHVIFPWIKIKYNDSETVVPLLVNQPGRSGEENLNTSIEMLEYHLTNAIQTLVHNKTRKIVFIEGHGELDEKSVADISDALENTYQIDRGVMSKDINQLNDYELVVIAGVQLPYTEEEKFILDQYIMRGGKVLWILNGVQLQSTEGLATQGQTISRINEINLADLLFTYGVRVNPVLIEDIQCIEIPVNTSSNPSIPQYALRPWYYAPLLVPNQDHVITKGLSLIMSEFTSSLSVIGNENPDIRKEPLLASSKHSHIVSVPEMISLQEIDRKADTTYFNHSYLPVAMLLEGSFDSGFTNRILPDSIQTSGQPFLKKSKNTQMIIVASEEIVRNQMKPGSESEYFPVGYDQYSQIQYGNRDFILNAVNYLTDNSGLMKLRSKTLELRLLNKQRIIHYKLGLILCNLLLPSGIIIILCSFLTWDRKRKYKA